MGVRSREWKLIEGERGRSRLYDLRADPEERHDVARRYRKQARSMKREMKSMLSREQRERAAFQKRVEQETNPSPVKPTEREIELLRALGYLD